MALATGACCNLVSNGSFEAGTTGWSMQSARVVTAPYLAGTDRVAQLQTQAALWQDITFPEVSSRVAPPVLEIEYRRGEASGGSEVRAYLVRAGATPGTGDTPVLAGGVKNQGTVRVVLQAQSTRTARLYITGTNVFLNNVYVGYGLKQVETKNPVLSSPASTYGVIKMERGIALTTVAGVGRWYPNATEIKFSDSVVSGSTDGTAGAMYRLYRAAFGRKPDAQGLGYQIAEVDKLGANMTSVARNFIGSPEFQRKYGSLTTTQFVTQLYQNVLGRSPDAAGLKYHVDRIDKQGVRREEVLMGFSESQENKNNVAGELLEGITFVERQVTPQFGGGSSGSPSGCGYVNRISAEDRALANSCGIQVSSFVAQADLRLQQIIGACQRGLKAEADREYNDQYDKMIRATRGAFEATSCGTATGSGITPSGGNSGFGTSLRYHVCTLTSDNRDSIDVAFGARVRVLVEAECTYHPSEAEDRYCLSPDYVYHASYTTYNACQSARSSLIRR